MAKVSFNKLNLKLNTEIKTIEFNGQIIEIKQYLPIEDKLELIGRVIELSHDQNNFSNPLKINVYSLLEIIESYTNISFTDKQKEDTAKLYDLFVGQGLLNEIINNIPEQEYNTLMNGIEQTVESIYTYHNSVLGILESISADYSNLKLDATEIQKSLKDSNNLELVKNIINKLG